MMPLVRPAPGFAAPNAALGGWGMDKVTNGTEPRGEAVGAVPSVESLLNSQAFRERLEGARLRREAALARRHDAAPEAILAASRPWEQADPQEILRRRAQLHEAPAKGVRPAGEAGAGAGRSTGVRAEPEPPAPAGPKPGFGALAEAMAAGRAAEPDRPAMARIPASTPAGAPAGAPTGAPTGADASVIVLRPASKETVGATMARAAAAMALLAEAGAGADRRAEPDRQAVPPVRLPARALPVSAQPVVPRRGRALLAVGGFVLGLTAGAVLAWVFARPAPVPVVAVPAPPVVASPVVAPPVVAPPIAAPAATAPAAAGHPLTGVIDVAARAPLLHAPAEGGAETGPAALPVTSPVAAGPVVRLAPAALPPVAAAPGPIPHTPDVLVMSATRGATAPDVPAGPVTLQPPVRQAPAELVASAAAGLAPRAGATVPAPAPTAAPRAPALPEGEAGIAAVLAATLPAGARGEPSFAPVLALPPAATLPSVPLPGAAAAVPALADRGPARPVSGPATDRTATLPGAVRPAARIALLAAPEEAAPPLPDMLPRVVPAPAARPAPSYAGFSLHVHAPGSIGDDALDRLAGVLAGIGFAPNPVARVGFSVRDTQVRFFHAADAAAAAVLAGAAGAVARDFTSFRPSPPQGTLELWLEGGTGGPAAGQPSRAKAPSDPLAARKRALRDLLVDQLRRGDHL